MTPLPSQKYQKVAAGERISDQDFLALASHADIYELGTLANTIRKRKHPGNVVSYVIDRNINYTDICTAACKFCAFYKTPEDSSGYLLAKEELRQKIDETLELGGTHRPGIAGTHRFSLHLC